MGRLPLLLSIIVVVLSVVRCSDREAVVFSCDPAEPGARDAITIRYRPDLSGPALRRAENVLFRFALLGSDGEVYSSELPMERRGREWRVRFRPSGRAGFPLVFLIGGVLDGDDPEFFDNHGGRPWVVPFLRDGEVAPGYHYQMFRLASGEVRFPDVIRVPMDEALIEKSVDAELAMRPDYLPARAARWTARLLGTRPGSEEYEALRRPIRTDLDSAFSRILLRGDPDTTAVSLLELYRMIGMSDRGDTVVADLRERFPESRATVLAESEWARLGANSGSLREAEAFLRRYPNAPEAPRVRDLLVKEALYSDERVDGAVAIVESGKAVAPPVVYALAWKLARAERREEAERLIRRGMKLWEAETRSEQSPVSEREWNRIHEREFSGYAGLLAYLAAERKAYDEAAHYSEKAVAAAANDVDAILLANHAEYLGHLGRTAEALDTYDRLAEKFRPDSAVVAVWRPLYEASEPRPETFDEHLEEYARRREASAMRRLERLVTDLPAPAAVVRDASGEKHHLSDYVGKVVVLDFWATWCGPCMASLPDLDEVCSSFSDRPDVVFLVLNTMEAGTREERLSSIRRTWEILGLDLPVYLDAGIEDEAESESAARMFRVTAIPRTIVIGRAGTILFDDVGVGGEQGAENLKAKIRFALART